jgi:hypothetical protein
MVVIWSPLFVGRVARRLGEDADRVADQRSLAEMNYVHSTLNTVHMSRSAFTEGNEAAAAGPHPRKPVTPTAPQRRLVSAQPWIICVLAGQLEGPLAE